MPVLIAILIFLCSSCYAQTRDNILHDVDDSYTVLTGKNEKQIKQLEKRYQKLSRELQKKREKIVERCKHVEQKITSLVNAGRISSVDSVYASIRSAVDRVDAISSLSLLNNYLPSIDSLATGANYLHVLGFGQFNGLASVSKQLQKDWTKNQLVQTLIDDRFRHLKSGVSSLSGVKMLKKLQNEIGYYQLQVAKYKQLLTNPDELLQAVLQIAKNQPAFAAYMSANSQLAGLFGMPGAGAATPLAGLQTLAGTQQQLTQQIVGSGVGNPSQFLSAQLNKGDQLVQALQQKINQAGGAGQIEMPDFKPNMQRTKKFLERWVWGINLQSQRPNGWLPTTTELGLMTGYQFNDKIIAGGGLAYKMGWGKSISNIHISHEGVGIRLFADMKLKGSIWISGGYEWNYQAAFNSIRDLSGLSSWQRSGLIGLSKKYNIGKKKGSIQLLWDFLSYEQVPQARALKFRVGYGL